MLWDSIGSQVQAWSIPSKKFWFTQVCWWCECVAVCNVTKTCFNSPCFHLFGTFLVPCGTLTMLPLLFYICYIWLKVIKTAFFFCLISILIIPEGINKTLCRSLREFKIKVYFLIIPFKKKQNPVHEDKHLQEFDSLSVWMDLCV